MTQTDTAFPNLRGHAYANLTTFRKTGVAVPTPIWFALHNGKLYVMTTDTSGKVKRIRNNPRVQLAPSDARGKPLGEAVEGIARVIPPEEPALAELAKTTLDDKYGLRKKLFDIVMKFMGRMGGRVYLEIAPA